MTFSSPSTPSISAQQLRDDGGLHVRADPGAAGAEDRVHLVEEHDHRGAFGRLLTGTLEDQPDVALGLADELVQQLRALDVEEVGLRLAGVVATDLGHLLGQRVGDGLGDQRLAAAGRAVEQHALRRTQRVLAVELLVQERQFDGVADLLDLPAQAADVVVADVGHLFEHQILDLGLGDALERVSGLGVDQQRVAGAQLARPIVVVVVLGSTSSGQELGGHQRLGQPDDALLVGVADHERAVAVGEDLAQRADLADRFEVARLDDRQRLVEADGLALLQRLGVDVRRARQPHLAAGGEHVDGVVLLHGQQHAVTARRLTQPVDLLAERQQLLTGLLEGFHQLGVSGRKRVDPGLELVHVAGAAQTALWTYRVLQLLAQKRGFSAQLFQFGRIVAGHASVGVSNASERSDSLMLRPFPHRKLVQ